MTLMGRSPEITRSGLSLVSTALRAAAAADPSISRNTQDSGPNASGSSNTLEAIGTSMSIKGFNSCASFKVRRLSQASNRAESQVPKADRGNRDVSVHEEADGSKSVSTQTSAHMEDCKIANSPAGRGSSPMQRWKKKFIVGSGHDDKPKLILLPNLENLLTQRPSLNHPRVPTTLGDMSHKSKRRSQSLVISKEEQTHWVEAQLVKHRSDTPPLDHLSVSSRPLTGPGWYLPPPRPVGGTAHPDDASSVGNLSRYGSAPLEEAEREVAGSRQNIANILYELPKQLSNAVVHQDELSSPGTLGRPTSIAVGIWSMGQYQFKGLQEEMAVVQVLPMHLQQRIELMQKDSVDRGKGRCVKVDTSLIATVQVALPDVNYLSCCNGSSMQFQCNHAALNEVCPSLMEDRPTRQSRIKILPAAFSFGAGGSHSDTERSTTRLFVDHAHR
eukprot:gene8099-1344_t